jgi:AraC family transcriptional regulator
VEARLSRAGHALKDNIDRGNMAILTRRRSAVDEMERVLDRGPQASPETYPGGVRVTRPWSHGALHAATRPMHEHVLMTYHGAARSISRCDGRDRVTALTRPGTVTIIPAGQAALWHIDGAIEVSHVYLPPARLQSTAESAGSCELLDRVAVEDATLAHLLALIAHESDAQDAPSRLMVEQALDLVMLQIGRQHVAHRRVPSPRGGLARWQLRRVTEHMTARMAEPVTLDELAALAGLSRYHFCSAFHRSMGMPPYHWLRVQRIEEAKRLLIETQQPIIEIALSIGYETPAAFARAFKAVVGLNPTAFRRRLYEPATSAYRR